ncbi:MAG: GtrA family protein [Bacillota bacterium]|nr:GtrA family protein [Bacillota bacterium]
MNIIKKTYNTLIKNKEPKHIIKFGCVGFLNTVLDFGIFSLLNSFFGLNYVVSQIISYSSGTFNSFLFNKFWTFNDSKTNKKTTMEMVQFIVVNSGSLGASLLGLNIFLNHSSMNSFLAKIISMVLAQVVNFLGYRFWVFGKLERSIPLAKKAA